MHTIFDNGRNEKLHKDLKEDSNKLDMEKYIGLMHKHILDIEAALGGAALTGAAPTPPPQVQPTDSAPNDTNVG